MPTPDRRIANLNETPRKRGGDDTLKSMVKMLAVLDCFSVREPQLTPSEIARRTRIPRATAHRIVATMRQIGLLDQDRERDSYRLGLKLFELGSRVIASMDLHREAAAPVDELQQLTGEVVHLCVYNGLHMVIIQRRELDVAPSNTITTMEEAPAHCTGVGKAFLAFQDVEIQERLIAEGLTRFTASTLVDPQALRAEFARIVAQGHAFDLEEHQTGIRCVAAPIRDATARVVAAVSVSGAVARMPLTRLRALAPSVRETARAISIRLGWPG